MHAGKLLNVRIWLPVAVVALQICAIRPVFKYLPYPSLSYFLLIMFSALGYYFLLHHYAGRRHSVLKSPLVTVILCLLIAGINFFMYPKADNLKFQGKGSDADDAVIIATTKLFQGQYPYDELTYMGHKMSPGPGMLLLMSPFVLSGTFFLALPFYVFLFALIIRDVFRDYEIPNLAILLLISCFGFWEYMIIGSDLLAIGALLAIVFYLLIKKKDYTGPIILLSLLTGLVLTSRITLAYLIPVIAWMLFRTNRRSGLIFGILATISCAGIHAFFYYWQPENYAPLHLLNKGQRSTHLFIILTGLGAHLPLLFFFLKQKSFSTTAYFKYAWLFVAVPHLFIGVGMVYTDQFNFAVSEGPGYLIIQIFLFILFYCYYRKQAGDRSSAPLPLIFSSREDRQLPVLNKKPAENAVVPL